MNAKKAKTIKPSTEKSTKLTQSNANTQLAKLLKLQEYDKSIAEAEHKVTELKSNRATYVYSFTVQQIVASQEK